MRIAVVMPAFNEEGSIAHVLDSLPKGLDLQVYVGDNASTDRTAEIARSKGAKVKYEPRRGYGSACLAALSMVKQEPVPPDVVVFLDADGADNPLQLNDLLAPIAGGTADVVVGSRLRGQALPGALSTPQRMGNFVSSKLLRLLYGVRFTDLGPFRAVRWSTFLALDMQDKDYGWTVELQIKVAKHRIPYAEIPVDYKPRLAGESKISRNVGGALRAGWKIGSLIIRHSL